MKRLLFSLLLLCSCGPSSLANVDYMTPHRMGIFDNSGACPVEKVEVWEHALVTFWSEHYVRLDIAEALEFKQVECSRDYLIPCGAAMANGCNWGEIAILGSPSEGHPNRTRDLFLHEVSHFILIETEGWHADHHGIMVQVGLEGPNRRPRP